MTAGEFEGRTALVTGGAKGIGEAIARRLLDGGATVVLWDLSAEGLEEAAGRLEAGERLLCHAVDVTDETALAAAADAAIERCGGLDILVNNAGIAGPTLPTLDYPSESWRRVVEVDLTGVFLCCKTLLPHLVARGWGRVVNVASLAGKEGTPNAAAYSAAKAGVIALTKSLGKELAGSGVLVNSVAPAAVETDILKQMTPEHVATMVGKSPLGRLGTPEEVAELVAWLCSDACSFSTGACFDLSGGRAVY